MINWHIYDRCEQKFIFVFSQQIQEIDNYTVNTNYVVIVAIGNVYVQTHFRHVFIIFVLKTKYLNGKINILAYLPVICTGGNCNICISTDHSQYINKLYVAVNLHKFYLLFQSLVEHFLFYHIEYSNEIMIAFNRSTSLSWILQSLLNQQFTCRHVAATRTHYSDSEAKQSLLLNYILLFRTYTFLICNNRNLNF